jgi:hypothetical protein
MVDRNAIKSIATCSISRGILRRGRIWLGMALWHLLSLELVLEDLCLCEVYITINPADVCRKTIKLHAMASNMLGAVARSFSFRWLAAQMSGS